MVWPGVYIRPFPALQSQGQPTNTQLFATRVTQGFRYKVRAVYAHFPINCVIESPSVLEIRNFLGEKRVRRVEMREGVTVRKHEEIKDCLIIEGNDIEKVGNSGTPACSAVRSDKKTEQFC